MNSLFEEYAKAVLGLDPNSVAMPRVPNPLLPFLEKKSKSKLEVLEMKRNRLQHMVKMLQDQLKTTDERLAQLRKEKVGDG